MYTSGQYIVDRRSTANIGKVVSQMSFSNIRRSETVFFTTTTVDTQQTAIERRTIRAVAFIGIETERNRTRVNGAIFPLEWNA
jgi:hypothetical protein